MILHIWMHWFWITSFSFKCFPYFAVQMISLTCIFYPSMTEAGLLENKTLVLQNFKLYKLNGSSQIEHARNITSVDSEEENHLPETTTSNPRVVFSGTEVANESASKSEEILESAESSDVEDTYTGGKLDVFQFPLKKFTKYSHLKYGKVKIRPGDEEETNEGGEKKVETVKIVEEKVRINISIAEEGNSESNADVSPGINVTESTEPSVTSLENFTAETNNGTEVLNETGVSTSTEESVINEESAKAETPISVSTTTTTTSTFATSTDTFRANGSEWLNVTEDQKDIEAFKNDTLVIENKVEESVIHTTVEPFPLKNRLAAATSTQNFELGQSGMNAGSVTGIILGILVIFGLFGAVSFVMYRRRYLNKPQVLHDKCSNLDSSGYIDDTSLRENSEEMYSLDNDSFLNSLEAMTIQNYWTENVKHTKL